MTNPAVKRIDELFEMGVPAKSINALYRMYCLNCDQSTEQRLIVESSNRKHALRPRLAEKMRKAGLIRVVQFDDTLVAFLDELGARMAVDLFEVE